MSESTELAIADKPLTGLPERFQPRNLTELLAWAKLVGSSGLAPKGMTEAGIVLAVQMGAELNVTPTQALQNIAVINGRPSIWGDLGLALFKRDAKFKSFEERSPQDALKARCGWCKITPHVGVPVERTFSIEDADTAGLIAKGGPWKQYPGRMLQMRARWLAMRDYAPEVFKGIASGEEQEDIIDVTHQEGTRITAPARKSEAAPESSGGGVDSKQVEDFLKDSKAPIGGGTTAVEAPPVDRSKLMRVLVKSSTEKQGGKATFYVVAVETAGGGVVETTTFDRKIHEAAQGMLGKFALIATKDVVGKKDGKTYKNITHIEAAGDAPETGPTPEDFPPEPGMNG